MQRTWGAENWAGGRHPVDNALHGDWFQNFRLQGSQNTNDPAGLLYAGDLEAFRAVQKLVYGPPPVARKYLRGDREKEIGDLYFTSI